MDYNQMVKETDELIRRVMRYNAISQWILVGAAVTLILIVGYCWIVEHQAKMRRMKKEMAWEEEQMRQEPLQRMEPGQYYVPAQGTPEQGYWVKM